MRILAFTDVHESVTVMKKLEALCAKEKPDLCICAGDFTVFEQHLDEMMAWMAKLPVPVMLIHGNHEEEAVVRKLCQIHKRTLFLHKHLIEVNGVTFVDWGGGGFDERDAQFEKFAAIVRGRISEAKTVVFVTHQPPADSKVDYLWHQHVGNKSYTKFIKQHSNIVFAISGHLHENFGREDRMHGARIVNPGPQGRVLTI